MPYCARVRVCSAPSTQKRKKYSGGNLEKGLHIHFSQAQLTRRLRVPAHKHFPSLLGASAHTHFPSLLGACAHKHFPSLLGACAHTHCPHNGCMQSFVCVLLQIDLLTILFEFVFRSLWKLITSIVRLVYYTVSENAWWWW